MGVTLILRIVAQVKHFDDNTILAAIASNALNEVKVRLAILACYGDDGQDDIFRKTNGAQVVSCPFMFIIIFDAVF